MKVAIVGSRSFNDYNLLCKVVDEHKERITLIVSGEAPGADTLGKRYALSNKIPYLGIPADWNNLDAPGAVIRRNKSGKLYNLKAGFDRNKLIVNEVEVVLAFWDGVSTGTKDTLDYAEKEGKLTRIERI